MNRERSGAPLAMLVAAALGCEGTRASLPPMPPSAVVRPEYRAGRLTLRQKAEHFEEALAERHLSPEGLVLYSISRRARAERPRHYGNLADAAYWTACALAAEALRWSVTREPDALERAERMIGALSLLQRVTGVPGLLSRTIDPDPDPDVLRGGRADWFRAPAPLEQYWVKGDVSKDQYCGVAYGYATAYDLLPEGPAREAIRRDLGAIARFLDRNDLTIRGRDGRPTTYSDLSAWIGPIPLGPNAAIALALFKAAAHATGDAAIVRRYHRLLRERYAQACAHLKFQAFGKTNHSNDLMSFVSLYTLMRLEPDARVREPVERGLDRLWDAVHVERNALFDLIYCAVRGPDAAALADAAETLRLFPETKRVFPVDNRGRADVPMSPWTSRKGRPKAAVALPINQRPMSSFHWKSDPYALYGNLDADGDQEYAAVDYLLAYWMARHHGFDGFEE